MVTEKQAKVPIESKIEREEIENPDFISTNFFWRAPASGLVDGTPEDETFDFQTTVRATLTPSQIASHMDTVIATAIWVLGNGGRPKMVGQPDKIKLSDDPKAKLPMDDQGLVDPNKLGDGFFETQTLCVTETNGKKYFKIKGGKWTQHGVAVWDEVLAEIGIKLDKLVAKDYPFTGYHAHYIFDGGRNPKKIISIVKVE